MKIAKTIVFRIFESSFSKSVWESKKMFSLMTFNSQGTKLSNSFKHQTFPEETIVPGKLSIWNLWNIEVQIHSRLTLVS